MNNLSKNENYRAEIRRDKNKIETIISKSSENETKRGLRTLLQDDAKSDLEYE